MLILQFIFYLYFRFSIFRRLIPGGGVDGRAGVGGRPLLLLFVAP